MVDVDGVLWIAGAPGQGAGALLDELRGKGMPFCLLTNDCSVSKAERHETLTKAGLVMRADQLVTAGEVTGEWLKETATYAIIYLGAPGALPDIAQGLSIREGAPVDAVVVGDLFSHYDRCLLDKAAKAVDDGASLVAMQHNARWSDGKQLHVDNGFWVAGLEYVTGRQALVMGKPSQHAYMAAVARLGQMRQDQTRIAFVSDDIAADLKGAKNVGLTTIYFGATQSLPTWVDYTVHDYRALSSLLINHGYD
ncbi:HAD-IIA family hydrolase [Patescibacteria group bacterium]|nr:HAD-IIA family hydrolase [Patescibacteria group bacterium]